MLPVALVGAFVILALYAAGIRPRTGQMRERPDPEAGTVGVADSPPTMLRHAQVAQLQQVFTRASAGTAAADELQGAIALAEEMGYRESAEALRARLYRMADQGDRRRNRTIRSPWPDVPDAAWQVFVRALATQPHDHVSRRGHLGMFWYDPRRLQGLGIARDARREADGRWHATFLAPLTEGAWLGDPDLQARTLAADMRRLRPAVEREFADRIGTEAEGVPITLSGLLAVEFAAGGNGLRAWLTQPEERTRFPRTAELYRRANGAF